MREEQCNFCVQDDFNVLHLRENFMHLQDTIKEGFTAT